MHHLQCCSSNFVLQSLCEFKIIFVVLFYFVLVLPTYFFSQDQETRRDSKMTGRHTFAFCARAPQHPSKLTLYDVCHAPLTSMNSLHFIVSLTPVRSAMFCPTSSLHHGSSMLVPCWVPPPPLTMWVLCLFPTLSRLRHSQFQSDIFAVFCPSSTSHHVSLMLQPCCVPSPPLKMWVWCWCHVESHRHPLQY